MTELEKIFANCRLSIATNNNIINGDSFVNEGHYINAFDVDTVLSVALASRSVMDKLMASDFTPDNYFEIDENIYAMMCNNIRLNINKINNNAFYASAVLAACFNKPKESIIIDLIV